MPNELEVRVRLLEDETADILKVLARDDAVHAEIIMKLNEVMLKKDFAAYVIDSGINRKIIAADLAEIRLSQAKSEGFKAAIGWIIGLGGTIGAAIVFLWDRVFGAG